MKTADVGPTRRYGRRLTRYASRPLLISILRRQSEASGTVTQELILPIQ